MSASTQRNSKLGILIRSQELTVSELGRLFHQLVRARLEHLQGKKMQVWYAPEVKAHSRLPAIAEVARRVREGDPLWPYLSKKAGKASFDDPLLNHWGIIHFHLGETFEQKGHIERTDNLLYAWISEQESEIYLLGIHRNHVFADERILNVVVRNWPDLLVPFRLADAVHHGAEVPEQVKDGRMKRFSRTMLIHTAPSMTVGQTTALRKAGVSPTFKAENGARYSPPGGGVSCAGTGTHAVVRADYEWWWATQLAKTVADGIEHICDQIQSVRNLDVDKLEFQVENLEALRAASVFEINTRVRLNFSMMEFDYELDPAKLMAPIVAAATAVR